MCYCYYISPVRHLSCPRALPFHVARGAQITRPGETDSRKKQRASRQGQNTATTTCERATPLHLHHRINWTPVHRDDQGTVKSYCCIYSDRPPTTTHDLLEQRSCVRRRPAFHLPPLGQTLTVHSTPAWRLASLHSLLGREVSKDNNNNGHGFRFCFSLARRLRGSLRHIWAPPTLFCSRRAGRF